MVFPKKILTIVLGVLIIATLAYVFVFNKTKGQAATASSAGADSQVQTQPKSKPEETPLPVKTASVIRGDLIMKLKSPGEAVTEKKVTVKNEVSGVIHKLLAVEGKHVKEGEILAEIDDQDIRLRLEQYEAARWKALSDIFLDKKNSSEQSEQPPDEKYLEKIKKAREAFAKAEADFAQGRMKREDWNKAKNDYDMALIESGQKKEAVIAATKGLTMAELNVKTTQRELEKTIIRAPFDGIVTDIKISPKETVSIGRDMFTVVNISEIKVVAKVLESEVGKIQTGREADLRFSAYPNRTFKGRVTAVSPIVNADDKTCSVHVMVDNPREEIKPGMHAEVEIVSEIFKNKLLVPHEAVLVRGGRKLVFSVEGGIAKWKYFQPGLENDQYVEIIEDFQDNAPKIVEGEQVIVEGHATLAHDAKVQPVNAKDPVKNN